MDFFYNIRVFHIPSSTTKAVFCEYYSRDEDRLHQSVPMLMNYELLLQPIRADLTSDMAYVTRVLANNSPSLAVAFVFLA